MNMTFYSELRSRMEETCVSADRCILALVEFLFSTSAPLMRERTWRPITQCVEWIVGITHSVIEATLGTDNFIIIRLCSLIISIAITRTQISLLSPYRQYSLQQWWHSIYIMLITSTASSTAHYLELFCSAIQGCICVTNATIKQQRICTHTRWKQPHCVCVMSVQQGH